ncbi:MAG TPA: acyl-CoA desaturase, partial [bacterium]|nr:acyl-CoA desaturase [bacterium]
LFSYVLRMFAITGFYHRYFSHRSFQAGRIAQFVFAFIGGTAAQRGALWWAGHHRIHHRIADTPEDPHSPMHRGFLYSHMLWFLTDENSRTPKDKVKDWRKFPELVWLDRFHIVPPVIYAVGMLMLGRWLETFDALHTSAWQIFIWGFVIATVAVYHGTYTINSLSHLYGSRRYDTPDTSRNNAILALITLGEGWHNNHHRYAVSTRQGFFPHELDLTYWGLRVLEKLKIVHDFRPVPESVLNETGGNPGMKGTSP